MTQLTEKKARLLRRSLYAVLLAGLGYVALPMVISAYEAIQEGKAIDPYTGAFVDTDSVTK